MNPENDDKLWGKSPWTYEELHNATIECNWDTDTERLIGVGTLVVRKRENGDIAINITFPMGCTNTMATEKVIFLSPRFFDKIQKHPDPAAARFLL